MGSIWPRRVVSALDAVRRSIQQQESVTKHSGKLLHPAEQLRTFVRRRVAQMLDDRRQVEPDRFNRILQRTALVRGGALRLTRPTDLGEINDLGHDSYFSVFFCQCDVCVQWLRARR